MELCEGDVQGNVYSCFKKEEEVRQGMALDGHLEVDRREEDGEIEDEPMQRWITEGEAQFNVHLSEKRGEQECYERQKTTHWQVK